MKARTPKAVFALVMALLLAAAGYWYWSPLLVVWEMQSAATAGDAVAFSQHVDFPLLRANLKARLISAFTKRLVSQQQQPQPGSQSANVGSWLATMLGTAVVDKLVEAVVRPETVMLAMREGRMMPQHEETTPPSSAPTSSSTRKASFRYEREGLNKFIAYASVRGAMRDREFGLVLERRGFASWELTDMRLSSLTKTGQLADQ